MALKIESSSAAARSAPDAARFKLSGVQIEDAFGSRLIDHRQIHLPANVRIIKTLISFDAVAESGVGTETLERRSITVAVQ
jgi:hypothetical protein